MHNYGYDKQINLSVLQFTTSVVFVISIMLVVLHSFISSLIFSIVIGYGQFTYLCTCLRTNITNQSRTEHYKLKTMS